MRRILVSIAVAALLLGGGRAEAETYAAESLNRYFTIEWEVAPSAKGPVIEGYVYNKKDQVVVRMILAIERLDGAGQVVGSSTVWVLGGIPAGNRTFFQAKTTEAAGYRVKVLTFDWGPRGS